jgi:hypothetical protein
MAKIKIDIREAITRRLHLLYDGIVDQGVPDRFAAILTAADGDPVVHAAALSAA